MNSLNHAIDIEIISGVCDGIFSEEDVINTDQNHDFINKSVSASSILIKEPISENHDINLSDTTECSADSNYHNNLINDPNVIVTCNQRLTQTVVFNTHVTNMEDPATHLKTEKPFFTQKFKAGNSGSKLRSISKYLNHNYISTKLKKKAFVCDICNKDFFHRCQLNVHYRMHHQGKHFLCKTCNKEFVEKHLLDTHLCKEKFVCEICCKAFSLRADLDVHLHSHIKENPYTCEVCGESFSMKFTLNTHLRTHRRPFL